MRIENKFIFLPVLSCAMCGAGKGYFKVLGKRLGRSQGYRPQTLPADTLIIVKQCRNCKLIFSDPMPVPEKIEQLYNVSPENYWSVHQINPDPGYFQGELNTLKSLLGTVRGKRVLDIGSGLGHAMRIMEEAGMEVWGLEPSAEFRDRCISRQPRWKDRILPDSIESFSPDGTAFDLVNFGAVLEHLRDPDAAISKAFSCLAPEGVIHIEVPNALWLVSRLARLQFRMRFLPWVINLSPMHTPYHLYEFSIRCFHENGKKNGYRVLQHNVFNTNSYLPSWMDTLIRPVMGVTGTGLVLKVWLGR